MSPFLDIGYCCFLFLDTGYLELLIFGYSDNKSQKNLRVFVATFKIFSALATLAFFLSSLFTVFLDNLTLINDKALCSVQFIGIFRVCFCNNSSLFLDIEK